jgi:hypothetical protein
MPERGFVRGQYASRVSAFTSTFRGGSRAIRGNRFLLLIMAVTFFSGAASEGLDRLWEAHLYTVRRLPDLGGFSRLYWFALIAGVATALSVGALSLARRWVERESDRALATTSVVLTTAIAGGCVLFGLSPVIGIAIGAYWAVRIARNVLHPTMTVWVVRHSEPAVRATVLSMEGQSHSIGEIAAGPFAGLVGRLVSIPAALVASGIVQAVAVPLLTREALRAPAEPPVEPTRPIPDEALPTLPGAEPTATDI